MIQGLGRERKKEKYERKLLSWAIHVIDLLFDLWLTLKIRFVKYVLSRKGRILFLVTQIRTVCPESSYPFWIVSYYKSLLLGQKVYILLGIRIHITGPIRSIIFVSGWVWRSLLRIWIPFILKYVFGFIPDDKPNSCQIPSIK